MPKVKITCCICPKVYEQYESKATGNKNNYCSLKCKNKGNKRKKIRPKAHIKYVTENILTQPFADIAKHLGYNANNLLRYVTTWRSEGHEIPKKPNGPKRTKPPKPVANVRPGNAKLQALKVEPVTVKAGRPLTGGRWERVNSRTLKYIYD